MNTTYFLNCVAGNVFRSKTSPAIPSTYYIGLSTTAPNMGGTGVTEPPTNAGYARVALTHLGAPANGVVKNTANIDWNESTANWGVVTHFVIYDSPTRGSGNLLMYGALTSPRTVEKATIMTIRQNDLSLSVSNPTA